jgi:hypothetical protein
VLLAVSGLLLSGCQSLMQKRVAFDPEGKEVFVINKLPNYKQKYGYDSFCTSLDSFVCSSRLSYEKYVGMKGYFETYEPIKIITGKYRFYPVVLENGESFFFVSSRKEYYGGQSPLIPIALSKEIESFKPTPIIPNSKIMITRTTTRLGKKLNLLSNGKKITEDDLNALRLVCKKYGNKPEMAELLLDTKIKIDEIEQLSFIQPAGYFSDGLIIYIGLNEGSEWLRFKAKYTGKDWLFVNSFKIAAGDFRWASGPLSFDRDHSGGKVWEWVDTPVGEKEMNAVDAVLSAPKATIRFNGNKYYHDSIITPAQKESIKTMSKLYELMANKKVKG